MEGMNLHQQDATDLLDFFGATPPPPPSSFLGGMNESYLATSGQLEDTYLDKVYLFVHNIKNKKER